MTIAIIDAYDNPKFVSRNSNADVNQDPNFLASDLHQFDLQYNLPEPASFFTKVDQSGGTNYPTGDTGWGTEIALDVEWVHAIAPGAKIILVEANSNYDTDLFDNAGAWARDHSGASVVSMSFGGDEYSDDTADGQRFPQPGRPRDHLAGVDRRRRRARRLSGLFAQRRGRRRDDPDRAGRGLRFRDRLERQRRRHQRIREPAELSARPGHP